MAADVLSPNHWLTEEVPEETFSPILIANVKMDGKLKRNTVGEGVPLWNQSFNQSNAQDFRGGL